MLRWFASLLLLSCLELCLPVVQAQTAKSPPETIAAEFTKYEYRIPMRDGVRLHTVVYVPKDDQEKYPILLMRTPYLVGPYGIDRYPDRFRLPPAYVKSGYIFAFQDVRGRGMSEGTFVNMRPHIANKKDKEVDESSDTYDTIEYLLKKVPGHREVQYARMSILLLQGIWP